MAEIWYYTSGGKQQDPVNPAELKRLARSGTLQPDDLVWKDGMAEWVEARSITGLCPQSAATDRTAPDRTPTADAGPDERPRPRRSVSDEADDDRPRRRRDETDEDDDSPRRRRRVAIDDDDVRPRRRARQGMSSGAKIGLIAGGLGVLVIAGVVVVILVFVGQGNTRSFFLADGELVAFHIRFTGGKKVEMSVNSNGNSDVDLYVFDSGGRLVRFDDGDSQNCHLWFIAQATQTFKVEVRNMHRVDQMHRNGRNNGTLTFKETDARGLAPPPPQVPQGRIVPPNGVNVPNIQPKFPRPKFQGGINKPPRDMFPPLNAVLPGKVMFQRSEQLTQADPLTNVRAFQCHHKSYDVKLDEGVEYTIVLESRQFDTFLRLENANGQMVQENDDGARPGFHLNSLIVFRPAVSGHYRLVATSLTPSQGTFTLTVRRP